MTSSNDIGNGNGNGEFDGEKSDSGARKINAKGILKDIKAGLGTREILAKHGVDKEEFEHILKKMIREGMLNKRDFRRWRTTRTQPSPLGTISFDELEEPTMITPGIPGNVDTYVINEPEKNSMWALELFSTQTDRMSGAKFRANLHGKKYSFVVEQLIFRGSVDLQKVKKISGDQAKKKREQALDYIAEHGWATYLENKAMEANIDQDETETKARLVILKCRNSTYVAALHTPAPTVNFYVAPSLEAIRDRLSKTVDFSSIEF